ncbi:MAG: peptidoglycan glycosyltransferase [Bacteroidetes bacterium HGW-Bacteroidetes-4]|jgi:cell division protein FtsI (penicillin-binding protein 3)|nr:MAG: peptidoglycan glycosyltransferase [Bacteroidetes bacterium HGW-Bacteroidetes-4]
MTENNTRKELVVRLSMVYIAVVAFALGIVVKVVYLQVAEHDKWINANTFSQKDIVIEPDRGDICASDGRILATSVPYYEVRIDLKSPGITHEVFNKNIDSLALALSNLFRDKSANEYKRELIAQRAKGSRYHLLQRRVDYTQLKEIKTFPILNRGQYKGGLIVIQENRRIQPFVNLASRTIGYQNKGGTDVGLEDAFNHFLSGEKGVRMVQRIAGNYWMPVNDGSEVEPQNGYDVITTIDINLQDVAHAALHHQLQRHSASHGVAILMEVKTGDVKAIVNLKRDKEGFYTEQFNYAIGERTEPGSTFKLPALMVALEDGYVDLDDSVDTGSGVVRYHDKDVRDSKEGGFGKITVQRAFEVSSNVGLSKIITQYYTGNEERFVKGLKRMSLTERLNVDIKGERSPYIKFPSDTLWSGVSLPQMAYGYEVEQTPLQILTFYNAVANNGKMLRPRFVKAVTDHGRVVERFSTQVINPTICSRSTINKAKKMLEGVVERGSAQNLKNSNYKIAGKTGTAQIANQKYGYKYNSQVSYQASFVGYFPADNPRYSCIVVVNAPSSGVYYGNLVAGQVFKVIADKVYSTSLDMHEAIAKQQLIAENIPYTRNGHKLELEHVLKELSIQSVGVDINSQWVATAKRDTTVQLYNRYVKKNEVPDVSGMGAKDALYILENLGLHVIVHGRGTVNSQSIQPGSRINKGDKIVLNLIS